MKTIAPVAVVALVLAAVLALPGPVAAQGNFHTIPPCRIFDSRTTDSPALAHNVPRLIQITGPECGVDGNSSAVAVNLTVTDGTSDGDVVLYPGDEAPPAPPRPSALPFKAGKTKAKMDIVALGAAGDINALATMAGGVGHSVHVIIDVNGYFVDDLAPVAEDDTAEVDEDSGATTIDVLANDTDSDGGPMVINSVQNPSDQGGTVLITNSGADLTYQPAADYCNDPPGTTPDTFTYTLNGGNSATVEVTVNCINDAPAGTDNTVATSEDTDYTFAAVDFGFTDPSDTPANAFLAVTITTLPAAGVLELSNVAVTAGQSIVVADIPNLTFTPAAGASGTPYTTFTFQVQDDGGTANGGVDLDPSANTMTINVTTVNNAPEGTDNTVATDEDTDYTFAAADFGFTDPNDTPPNAFLAVTITTLPAAGVLELSNVAVTAGQSIVVGDIPNLTFTPAAGASGTPYTSFTFQVQDDGGTAGGGVDLDPSANTMTINVDSVNDAPAGTDNTIATNEDADYVFAAADFGFTDPNDTPANNFMAVTITTLPAAGVLELSNVAVTAGQSIVVADIPNLTFTPAAGASGTPYTTFTFQVQDDGGTANGGVDLDPSANTMTINVNAANDAPAGTDNTVTTDEDTDYTFAAADFGFTDPNDTPANNFMAVTITTLPAAGVLELSNVAVTAGQSIVVGDIPNLTFTPAASGSGTPYTTFTFQVQDDGGTANGGVDLDPSANTMTINVNAINDAPAGTDNTVATNEDTDYVFAAANFGFTDPNDTPANNFMAVTITTLPAAGVLELSNVAVTAGQSIVVADIPNLTFTPAAGASGTPYTTFTFQVQDDGGTANGGVDLDPSANTMTINVNPVNDAPAGTDNTVTTDEDVDYVFAAADFGFTDPSDTPANNFQAVTITTLPAAGVLELSNVAVSAGQSILLGSIPNLTFTPAPNAFGTPYTSFTFQVQDDGGTANGGVNLDPTPNTMTINVNPVNDPPSVVNESFDIIGNTELRVDMTAGTTPHASETTAGASSYEGVLDNDGDPEGDTVTVTAIGNGCSDVSAPFDCTLTDGAVVHVDANGEFSYTPGPGDVGAGGANDLGLFTYTVTDQPGFGTPLSANGTVTFNDFEMVWYVDNSQGVDGNGTSISPMNAIDGDLNGGGDLDGTDDYIFVDFGTGTNSGQASGIALESGQHLLGEFAGLSIPVNLNGNGSPTVLVPQPGATDCSGGPCRPVISHSTGAAVSATDVIPIEIVGLSLSSTQPITGNAIDWTTTAAFSGTGTLTIRDNVVTGAVAEGVEVTLAGTGATNLAFHDNTLTATGTALDVAETGSGSLTITAFHDNVVTGNSAGAGINVVTADFDATPGGGDNPVPGGTTVIGEAGNRIGGAGLTLTSVTGDLNLANGASGTIGAGDLDIYTDSGAALSIGGGVGGFEFDVTASAGTLVSNAGPAAVISGADVSLQLSSLTSTNSATTGVSLTTVTGTFSAPSGSSISNAGTTDFEISGGTATVTYGGTITDDVGQLVSVSGTTAGTKTFSGAITDSGGAAGGGISLSSNTGATISFSGGLTLSTGTTTAFAATGGGTVTVTDPASGSNTIATTSGTALNVNATTIGAGGLVFECISAGISGTNCASGGTGSGSPANGIVLNNTGSTAGLTVTGSGSTDGSGGTIRGTSGDGVSLTSTRNVNLSNMVVGDPAAVPSQAPDATATIGGHGISMSGATNVDLTNVKIAKTGGHGITGTDVTDLDITDGEILNAGNGDEEHGLNFGTINTNNLDGTVNITNTTIDAFAEAGLFVENWSGTLNLTLNNATIGRNANTLCGGVTCGENGIEIRADATSAAVFSTINVDVINSFFDDVDGNGIFVVAEGAKGTADVDINTTRIENATALGIVLFGGDLVGNPAVLTFDITNMSSGDDGLFDINSNAISIQPNGSSTMTGNVNGVKIQGSNLGYGIDVPTDDDAKAVLAIDNNNISQTECNGIRVLNGNTAELDVHIRNNTVGTPDDDGNNGICHGVEVNVRETSDTCLDILANSSANVNGSVNFRTRQRDTSAFKLERFTGSGTSTAAVVAFLQDQNDPPVAGQSASATVATTYTGVADGACEDP